MTNELLKSLPQPATPSDCNLAARSLLTAVVAAFLLYMDHLALFCRARSGHLPADPLGTGKRMSWSLLESECSE
jgi:hypothetical protein